MARRWRQRTGHRSPTSRGAAFALLMLAIFAGQFALAAPAGKILYQTPSTFSPHSGPAQLIQNLSFFVLQITGAIFVVVATIWLYVIIRFRQRDSNDDSEPPQVYGSTQIELAWTVIPVLIVVVLFLTTARILFAIQDQKMPPTAMTADVIGHQFWWEFHYTGYGFNTAGELHVPVSTDQAPTVTSLRLLSADVDHSFWVPELFGKIDSIPNQVNNMWFNPTKVGMYVGQCAQFCGVEHAKMLLRVYVQTPQDFAAWVRNQQLPAVQDAAVVEGRHVFESQSCVSCHVIRGTSAQGRFGPDLTHLMSRDTIASGASNNTPADLKLWIRDPDYVKPGCLMPSMQLSDDQMDKIVSYLATLK